MRAGHVWRGRIAPAHEVPRKESNNKAHEPTSGRSTRYESGHLIRAFRDIGCIFSSQCPSHWRFCFLVGLSRVRDLLLCAKHLFVAANVWHGLKSSGRGARLLGFGRLGNHPKFRRC
jgi:hypothetical protein